MSYVNVDCCVLKSVLSFKQHLRVSSLTVVEWNLPRRNTNIYFTRRLFGRFPFRQNFPNFGFGGKWNTFRSSVRPLENSQKKWKIWKDGPVFPVGISERNFVFCLHVSRSLYQFQVHGLVQPRTGVYDQMEQLFTNRKFHFCSHRNFRVFFLNGKRPLFCVVCAKKYKN